MIDPIPSGTRDVLPDEMRELRAITEKVRAVFDARGYGEVATPALEYETTLARGDAAAAEPAYRLFDEQGNVLVLRSDMTIPIARVVATRYASSNPPLRFCYFAHAYRSVRPSRGQAREMLQAGIELVGAPGPEGTVEALELLCEVLDAVGLDGYRFGLGDASLYPALLDAVGVPEGARRPLLHELVTRDFVGLEREIEGLRLGKDAAQALLRTPQLRALLRITRDEGLTMGELARHIGISCAAATQVVDQLVEMGLVTRERKSGDRRVVRLRLTELAHAELDAALARRAAQVREVCAHLSPEEARAFAKGMELLGTVLMRDAVRATGEVAA